MRSCLILAVLALFASGCVTEDDEPAPQRPPSTYVFNNEGILQYNETFDIPSCVYSRQEPSLGQYSVDARMVNQPNAENPAVIQLRFPGSVDEPPAAGTYALPGEADLTMTFGAPLGSMVATGGKVTVNELADFRQIRVEGMIEGVTERGVVVAVLYCPL